MNTSETTRIAVIMAGGMGERFWPLSRRNRPKQFLHLAPGGTTSLIDHVVTAITPIFTRERINLVTGVQLADVFTGMPLVVPVENMIIEPFKRNTAGCLALAAAVLMHRYQSDGTDITLGVFTSDFIIGRRDVFQETIEAALATAEREDALVTLAVKPVRSETGYGYIEVAGETAFSIGTIPVRTVRRFIEKPDLETARTKIATGNFFWNSGLFFWRLSTFLGELGAASPDYRRAIDDMRDALGSHDQQRFRAVFEDLEDISIDYLLMEKASRALALEADFGWDDLGAFDALDRILPQDEHGNVIVGDSVVIDARDCIVYNDSGADKMAVGVIGTEGLAVIVTGDGVLVVPKDRAQEVRAIVTELNTRLPDTT